MKNIIIVLMLFAATKVSGQYITASEMIDKTNCKAFECYNEFMMRKGFSYEHSDIKNDMAVYYYKADKLETEINNEVYGSYNIAAIAFVQSKLGSYAHVSIRTSNKHYCQQLIDGFKEQGFTVVNTKQTNDGVATEYKSKRYPNLTFRVSVSKSEKNGESWTGYDLSVV